MTQIIITGSPTFEDVRFLVDMLAEADRKALRNYLTSPEAEDWEQEFGEALSRFRTHAQADHEVEEAVAEAVEEVRDAEKAQGL